MNVLIILMPIALGLGVAFTLSFVYAVRSGQFDDMETPAHRVLLDDASAEPVNFENGKGKGNV